MSANRITLLSIIGVVFVHVWVLSAGWMTYWPQYTSHCNQLADALSHRQLSLRFVPSSALLALADPYDPIANEVYRLPVRDLVLFNGRFYLYWGPVPALLLVPFKLILRGRVVGDQYPVFAFTLGLTISVALLLRRIWKRFFHERSPWLLGLAIVVVGISMPMPYTLARSAAYEAAILGGQCFLVAGIYFAFPMDRLPGWRGLATASVCWALALGCRVSLLFAVGALFFIAAWQAFFSRNESAAQCARSSHGNGAIKLIALAAPLQLCAILLVSYNVARFGNWTEFGQKYQLTNANYRNTPHLFQPANAIPGLYSYLLRPIQIHPDFPFLDAIGGQGAFPRCISLPEHYEYYEPIAGLLIVTPIVIFALIPLCRLVLKRDEYQLRLLIAVLLCASILGFAPIPFMLGSTMRYLCDLTPCLLMLACIGLWQGFQWRGRTTHSLLRRLFVIATTLMAGWSIAAGLLLGITGYYQHFRTYHCHLFGNISYWMRESE